jgi:hypothetical protein
VARGIRSLKGHFLLGLDLTAVTLDELNRTVWCWLAETADVRIHGTTRERPLDRWEAEHLALRPLAGQPDYDTSSVSQRLVRRDGYLAYRGSRSAGPPAHAGRLVLVKEGEDRRVRIFAGAACVSDHPLAARPGQTVAIPGHVAAIHALTRRQPPVPADLPVPTPPLLWPQVESRSLAAYDAAAGLVEVGG